MEVYMFFLIFLFLLGGGDGCGSVHVLFNVSVFVGRGRRLWKCTCSF